MLYICQGGGHWTAASIGKGTINMDHRATGASLASCSFISQTSAWPSRRWHSLRLPQRSEEGGKEMLEDKNGIRLTRTWFKLNCAEGRCVIWFHLQPAAVLLLLPLFFQQTEDEHLVILQQHPLNTPVSQYLPCLLSWPHFGELLQFSTVQRGQIVQIPLSGLSRPPHSTCPPLPPG